MRNPLIGLIALAFSLAYAMPCVSQLPDVPEKPEVPASEVTPPDKAVTQKDLEASKASVVAEIRAMGGTVSPSGVITGSESGSTEAELAQAVITRIDAQLAMLRTQSELVVEQQKLQDMAKAGPSAALPEDSESLDFGAFDSILDQLEDVERALEQAQEEKEETLRSLEDAKRRVDKLDRRRRLEQSGTQGQILDPQARQLRWQTRIAREEVGLEQLRLAVAELRAQLRSRERDYWRSVAESGRKRLAVTEAGLIRELARIDEQSEQERERLVGLDGLLDEAHADWIKVQERSSDSVAGLKAEQIFRRTRMEVFDDERQIRLARLEALTAAGEIWRLRYAAAGALADGSTRAERVLRVEELERELERHLKNEQQRVEELQRRKRQLADRGKTTDPVAKGWAQRESEALAEGTELALAHLGELKQIQTLADRTLLETQSESIKIREVISKVRVSLEKAWQWELISFEDEPITVGKIFLALLLVIVGYFISKRISRSMAGVLMERFSVSQGAAHALQSFVFYVFVVSFFLWGFHLVGIPLTVFTLLGGVVAIGVGFGSQNVVNNFISGLILLAERPIKVGDLVDVDGVLGTIERIGLRSTRVRAGNNTHIFVPNSSFLEKNVLNWTSTDDLVRSSVDVGVAYGSPVVTVKELMLKALDAEPLVVKSPRPEVLFMEFGDNALLFRGYFWHGARQGLDSLRVQSALRFRFDELFAEANIVIAFPQRDVHLDTLSPLRIQLLDPAKPDSEGPALDDPGD